MNEQALEQQIEATIWLFEQKKVRSHEEKRDLLRRLCACATDSGKPQRNTRRQKDAVARRLEEQTGE